MFFGLPQGAIERYLFAPGQLARRRSTRRNTSQLARGTKGATLSVGAPHSSPDVVSCRCRSLGGRADRAGRQSERARSHARRRAAQSPMHVLFIGNSYTRANDLRHTVQRIAEGVPSGSALRVTSIANPGWNITHHWLVPETRETISAGGFTHIILQGHSLTALQHRDEFEGYARLFDDEIDRHKDVLDLGAPPGSRPYRRQRIGRRRSMRRRNQQVLPPARAPPRRRRGAGGPRVPPRAAAPRGRRGPLPERRRAPEPQRHVPGGSRALRDDQAAIRDSRYRPHRVSRRLASESPARRGLPGRVQLAVSASLTLRMETALGGPPASGRTARRKWGFASAKAAAEINRARQTGEQRERAPVSAQVLRWRRGSSGYCSEHLGAEEDPGGSPWRASRRESSSRSARGILVISGREHCHLGLAEEPEEPVSRNCSKYGSRTPSPSAPASGGRRGSGHFHLTEVDHRISGLPSSAMRARLRGAGSLLENTPSTTSHLHPGTRSRAGAARANPCAGPPGAGMVISLAVEPARAESRRCACTRGARAGCGCARSAPATRDGKFSCGQSR